MMRDICTNNESILFEVTEAIVCLNTQFSTKSTAAESLRTFGPGTRAVVPPSFALNFIKTSTKLGLCGRVHFAYIERRHQSGTQMTS
jgi:hypothetical protein